MSHLPKFSGPCKADQRRGLKHVNRNASQRHHAKRHADRRTLRVPIAGSIRVGSPRTRYLAATIHALGPQPLHELLCDLIVASPATLPLLERYAALAACADLIAAYGGRELPPHIQLIKERP